jgi:hypothetical protein
MVIWGFLLAADEAMLDPRDLPPWSLFRARPVKPTKAAIGRRLAHTGSPPRSPAITRNHPIVIHGVVARSTPITSGSSGALPLAETAPAQ